MAYSDDAVKAKLAALNETQDSIVTVAQWIMFHRRHANRTAALWLARLTDSSTTKRLNLLYLANEVVQQSRARSKNDFLLAFEPLIADATALAYKNASVDVQAKIKRVVEVWRQRGIFEKGIQEGVERRVGEIDKVRGNRGSGAKLGGSLFGGDAGGGVALGELEGASKALGALSKAEATARGVVGTANTEYAKMMDPETVLPTPPVHAARLAALMKSLATAQGAVEASIAARKSLVASLQTLLEANTSKLTVEETTAADLATRRQGIEDKKREVEDGIMRGLSNPTSPVPTTPTSTFPAATNGADSEAPEIESLTPPPPEVETFTPPPAHLSAEAEPNGHDSLMPDVSPEPAPKLPPSNADPTPAEPTPSQAVSAAQDILGSLQMPQSRSAIVDAEVSSDPRKRRKVVHKVPEEDVLGGMAGVDEDAVSAMLG
ncbi:hypothetical protein LTR95_003671 [Oleoguttula sp. CCFEE 5521]